MTADALRADLDRANAAMGGARFAEAAALYQSITERDAGNFAAWVNLAGALAQLSRFDEAIAAADRAHALRPTDARALNAKGVALNALNRPQEALACFDKALAAAPDYVAVLVNRAAALQALGQADEAIASLDRALLREPNNPAALYYRALALAQINRPEEALATFDAALRLAPNDPDIAYSKGVALLSFGAWREAWPLFERRWQARRVRAPTPRDRGEPRWNGVGLSGQLRVWAEQGVGDQILFGGLLPQAHERAAHIELDCDPRLAPLFRRSFPWLEGASGAAAQCPLGSLGGVLGVAPADLSGAPYLVADPAQRSAIRTRYEVLAKGKPIVGISWFSQNQEIGSHKSSALEDWAPLLTRDAFFVNLQYHSDAAEIAAAEAKFGCVIHTDPHVDQVANLDAFAAQIAVVDRMISVSNSGVHLAGALGAPCTLLAPAGRGLLWYWGAEGETTPWYNSVRIVRRAAGEAWPRVIERAAAGLPSR